MRVAQVSPVFMGASNLPTDGFTELSASSGFDSSKSVSLKGLCLLPKRLLRSGLEPPVEACRSQRGLNLPQHVQ